MSRTQNVEPFIETNDRELQDSGVPSHVAIAGHPLHPLIVTFPITFLVSVVATDLAYWWTRDAFWATASFWLIGAGIVTGILAALSGMVDFAKINRVRENKAGWIHMVGNVAALLFSTYNFFIRWNNVTTGVLPSGLVVSIIVAVLLGITGWYGGELVYRHKIAVVGEGSHHRP